MAEATLIIEANLECEKCYRKIQKILRKLEEKEKIKSIIFDNKMNKVIVFGTFDPEKLKGKICCKARKAIKNITIGKPPEQKKPDEKKPEEKKKSEEKKPEEKKAEEKKHEEKKPQEKKAEEKKPEEVKKPEKNMQEAKAAAPRQEPSTTTVNLQFTQICNLCYPWPCSDPSHWGGAHQYPQPPQPQPQWPCGGMPPPTIPGFPGHHQPCPPPLAPPTPKRTCGGPSYCGGGCGSCGGWPPAMPTPMQMMQPPPMCSSGGPSSCRGCKGCRIVQEGRFIYEEYPPSSCAVM